MENSNYLEPGNFYSQYGEDGIILHAHEKIGALAAEGQRWCVAFGAGDGIYCSNILNLVKTSATDRF
tara:strand:- start:6113 stop:6313 length:201 start_codon:yes stop_codon:yes gene_type:complete